MENQPALTMSIHQSQYEKIDTAKALIKKALADRCIRQDAVDEINSYIEALVNDIRTWEHTIYHERLNDIEGV